MAANSADYFTKVGSPGTATTLSAPGHLIGGTSITVVSTSNHPSDTGYIFAMDTVTLVNGVEVRDVGSYTEWEGVVSGATSITTMVLRKGTDQDYPAGATTRVYIPVAASQNDRMVDGLLVEHDQAGTHTDITADSIVIADGGTIEVDTVNEATTANGVTIDGVLNKDSISYGGGVLVATRNYVLADSPATWSKPTGLRYVVVEVIGGGGGGGGVSKSSAQSACAGAGGAGGYSMKKILAATLGTTETVTIGDGGAGGSAGNNNGVAGATSSFGAHATATGGGLGNGEATSATVPRTGAACGLAGVGASGDINIYGGSGVSGGSFAVTSVLSSIGGKSQLSGSPAPVSVGNLQAAGAAGLLYGGGGSGGVAGGSSTTAVAGGAGAAGIVIVKEYY